MMADAHTPGPWKTSLSDDTVVIHVDSKGVLHEVASIDGDYNEPDLWPVMEANARLIAAAPDLLMVLQALVAAFDADQDYFGDEYARAIAAIAKATGA